MEVTVVVADRSWRRLRRARMAGLTVHYGEVLSEVSEETLDMGEIGALLALSSNDAYNALVCTKFAAELGRDRVFQLAMTDADEDDPRGVSAGLRGAAAFGEEIGYERLLRRHYEGWEFRRTPITEEYDVEDHRANSAEGTLWFVQVSAKGRVTVWTDRNPLRPAPGDTVLGYGPPEGEC
jgi:hypothetical protein